MAFKIWRYLPAEWGHALAPFAINASSWFSSPAEWRSFSWKGIYFANRLGTAGGFDKSGVMIDACYRLGFGFVEVGTVTPLEQKPNPGKIIDRDWDSKTLWNKMGFPSVGVTAVVNRLKSKRTKVPVFLNIGKNRTTPNESADGDYAVVIQKTHDWVQGFVINISSPNTKGLRELQSKEYLLKFLSRLRPMSSKPMLLKLSPDLSAEELEGVLEALIEAKFDGVILTNTTVQRGEGSSWPVEGGLSGAVLKEQSEVALQRARAYLDKRQSDLLLVSVGGVLTPKDVAKRLELGADLVQVYSAMVFEGFAFPKNVAEYFQRQDTSNL